MLTTLITEQQQYQYIKELFTPGAYSNPEYAEVLKNREETGPKLWEIVQRWSENFDNQLLKISVAKYCREFELGVIWSEELLNEIDEAHQSWFELQQLRLYCYEFDYELETAFDLVEMLLEKGYEVQLWSKYANLLYKLHRTQEAVSYLQQYGKQVIESAAVAKEQQKYERYLQKDKRYQPMYEKGDKTLQKRSFKSEVVVAERIQHESPFSIRVLMSSSSANVSLLHVEGDYYLIDCGASKTKITQLLAANGLKLAELAGIFITHSHSDHTKGLAMMTKYSTVPVFLDTITAREIKQRAEFQASGNTAHFQPWKETQFQLGALQVQVLETSHDTDYSCGFKFQYQDKTLVYLTDLGTIDANLLAQSKGAHCYIFESNHEPELLAATNRPAHIKKRILSDHGHLNNKQSAKYLQQLITAETQAVILAHLSQEANTEAQAKQIFEQYNAEFTGNFQIAKPDEASSWQEIGY